MRPGTLTGGTVKFEKGRVQDDAELTNFCSSHASEGSIRISLHTTPSYFEAQAVGSLSHDALIARSASGEIVATGGISRRRAYFERQPISLDYLSGLRIAREFQRGTVLARGYRELKNLRSHDSQAITLTTILEKNHVARAVLESRRAGMPLYQDIGAYSTLALTSSTRVHGRIAAPLEVRPLKISDLDEWILFLTRVGSRRQFYPTLSKTEFLDERGPWRGITVSNIWGVWRQGKFVGTAALWDQSSFRRWIVKDYRLGLRWFRGIYNIRSRMLTQPHLPPPGDVLNYKFLSLVCIDNDDPVVFDSLLNGIAVVQKRDHFLLAGFHESDPLLKVAKGRQAHEIRSRLYVVNWDGKRHEVIGNSARVTYIEPGTL